MSKNRPAANAARRTHTPETPAAVMQVLKPEAENQETPSPEDAEPEQPQQPEQIQQPDQTEAQPEQPQETEKPEAKTEEVKAPEAKAPEAQQPQAQQVFNIAEIKRKAQERFYLSEEHDKLNLQLEKIRQFQAEATQDANLRLSSNGANSFTSNDPEAVAQMVEIVINRLNGKIQRLENLLIA